MHYVIILQLHFYCDCSGVFNRLSFKAIHRNGKICCYCMVSCNNSVTESCKEQEVKLNRSVATMVISLIFVVTMLYITQIGCEGHGSRIKG